jgi:hypothetical protein
MKTIPSFHPSGESKNQKTLRDVFYGRGEVTSPLHPTQDHGFPVETHCNASLHFVFPASME